MHAPARAPDAADDRPRRQCEFDQIGAAALTTRRTQAQAQAAPFPTQNLRFVVPFAPGGATDIVARLIQPGMQENLRRSVVIENRGGAAGMIGSEAVLNAPHDGHTFIIYTMTNAVLAPGLLRNARIDARRDFQPVSLVARLPMVLTVGNHVPARNLEELVGLMRQNPGRLTYGSAGIGSLNHFGGHMLNSLTNTQATHVPYRGSGPVFADMIAGNVDMMIEGIASQVPFVRNNQIRAIATLAPERSPQLPEVPTAVEQGMRDFNIVNFMAIFAPSAVPAPIRARISELILKAARDPETIQMLERTVNQPMAMSGEDFRHALFSQAPLIEAMLTEAGMKRR